jgi:hypothetical protein
MKLAWYFQSRESCEEYTRILGKLSPQIKEDLRSEFDQMLTDYLADITADKKEAEEYRSWLDGSSRPPKFCPACEREVPRNAGSSKLLKKGSKLLKKKASNVETVQRSGS